MNRHSSLISAIQLPNHYTETPDIETSSEGYAERFGGEIGEWFLQVQERATLRAMAEWDGATVLDVGGGHGQLTYPLLRSGYRVTVLGSAPECESRIRQYVDSGSCKFEVGDLLDLPFGDESFDVVISFRLVPHIEQWQILVSELARVARRAVIIDYPSLISANLMAPLLFKLKRRFEGNTRRYRSFSEKELVRAFERQGFVRVQRYPEFFLPMVVHRALKQRRVSEAVERLFRCVGLTTLFGSPVILKLVRECA